jgi:hypothetical protein
VPSKGKDMHKLYPDDYYIRYWFDKKTSEGIDLIAAIEQIPRRQVVPNLIEAGFRHYILEKTKQHLDNEVELHQRGEHPVTDRFVRLFRRYAKQNGVDISKIL